MTCLRQIRSLSWLTVPHPLLVTVCENPMTCLRQIQSETMGGIPSPASEGMSGSIVPIHSLDFFHLIASGGRVRDNGPLLMVRFYPLTSCFVLS
jgi:hypothetical protein